MQQLSLLGSHERGILSVAYHSQSGLFFSGAKDLMALGFDCRAPRRPALSLQHEDWVAALHAAAAPLLPHTIRTGDKRVHTWDVRFPTAPLPELPHKQHCHKQLISGLRSDALRLVSCSLDGCVLSSSVEAAAGSSSTSLSTEVLDVAAAGAAAAAAAATAAAAAACFPRAVGQQHSDWLLAVDFAETKLAAAAANGVLRLYDFSQRLLQQHECKRRCSASF
ncbi:hypothetical protein, conserved [Eimeria tenella]|uniref:WD domain, G-beta repeat-containing protein n=1 Tax=Eimeria tenella TaxID=5802 RepID=U6L043_EIMTE|nr:hypothetical protein, conserved [Eimeria tenella]CDJ43792.1 hypothetical protein, conserved [Eimeria tenella]|eukprot:XP_013234541.1 hypothetical protein, conserved [Eimeria tenella]